MYLDLTPAQAERMDHEQTAESFMQLRGNQCNTGQSDKRAELLLRESSRAAAELSRAGMDPRDAWTHVCVFWNHAPEATHF